MKSVQDKLCVRQFARACRLLLLVLSATGSLRADVVYGPFVFQQDRSVPDVYERGWLVTTEPQVFCPLIFSFNDPLMTLYSSPNPLPNAADHGLPESEVLFLGPSLNSGVDPDVLFRVASYEPMVGVTPDPVGRLTFATSGTPVSVDTTDFAADLNNSVAGGGKYLATNFAADYVLSAADFTSESQQAILYYDPMDGGAHSPEGQFTGSTGYLGFRFESLTNEEFYGWLHITDINTSVSNSNGQSYFGFIVDSFAIRASSGTEFAGIRIGSSDPGMFSSVPEPGTYGVMLVLGTVLGLRAYRRRGSVAVTAA